MSFPYSFIRGHLIWTIYVCTTIRCSEDVYIPKDETFESFLNTCGDESEKITEILQGRLHFVELASTDRGTNAKVPKLKFLRDDSSNAEMHFINLSLLAFGKYFETAGSTTRDTNISFVCSQGRF